MIATAVAIGLGVGVVLGGLGGGGSVLTVPALVFLLGEPPHRAATASLVIVGISSMIGLLARARAGEVRWVSGLGFGAIGALTAVGGTVLSRSLNPHVLLLAFAALTLLAAFFMLRRAPEPAPAPSPSEGVLGTVQRTRHVTRSAKIVPVGAVVGLATGLFGVGGGFLVVPALVVALSWPMPIAIGTSLLVIVVNSAASLSVRIATEPLDWRVIIPVTLAAVIGTLLGKTFADRVSTTSLSRAFAALLVAVAAYTATTSLIALL
ncbi:MAG: sulfite exporter TauE/SafE family protein [Actinomycetota bacterium]|nr:sulfite exporter TauE/SafE family protein [Actinomycetota bacterium]